MKAEKISIVIGILVILLLAFLIVRNADFIGVPAGGLERDARENQKIDGEWEATQAINKDMCAMLFYNAEKNDCRFSVYVTREGMSYGYFFREGGADGFIVDGVRGFLVQDKGIVLLSLNAEKVCRIEIDGKTDIEIDSAKPFVMVLPEGCSEISMFNTQGDLVTLYDAF